MAIDFPADLLDLERSAWASIQAGTLTVDLATRVQLGITALAAALGTPRCDVEQALKRQVRHGEATSGA